MFATPAILIYENCSVFFFLLRSIFVPPKEQSYSS